MVDFTMKDAPEQESQDTEQPEKAIPQEDIEKILEYIGIAKEAGPIVDAVMFLLQDYGKHLKIIFDAIGDYQTERQIKNYKNLVEGGFSEEQAYTLVLSRKESLANLVSNINIGKKGGTK